MKLPSQKEMPSTDMEQHLQKDYLRSTRKKSCTLNVTRYDFVHIYINVYQRVFLLNGLLSFWGSDGVEGGRSSIFTTTSVCLLCFYPSVISSVSHVIFHERW